MKVVLTNKLFILHQKTNFNRRLKHLTYFFKFILVVWILLSCKEMKEIVLSLFATCLLKAF